MLLFGFGIGSLSIRWSWVEVQEKWLGWYGTGERVNGKCCLKKWDGEQQPQRSGWGICRVTHKQLKKNGRVEQGFN